jgi:shikimate dehydrogenase
MNSKPYAEVIGDPISHSKSPLIHNFWLEKLGIDAEYRRCHVKPEELADYFEQSREEEAWRGCNVTVPHKEAALRLADHGLAGYSNIGAANIIVPRNGELCWANSDMDGVAGVLNDYHQKMINQAGVSTQRKFSVGIIGAGGAAKAAAAVANNLPWIGQIRISVRRPGTGAAMLESLEIQGEETILTDAAFEGLDVLVNASTMGMGDAGDSALTLASLGNGSVKPLVFDMVYFPIETGLLRAARTQGHNRCDGLAMLIIQARAAFVHFFGEEPPNDRDAELRALLTA